MFLATMGLTNPVRQGSANVVEEFITADPPHGALHIKAILCSFVRSPNEQLCNLQQLQEAQAKQDVNCWRAQDLKAANNDDCREA